MKGDPPEEPQETECSSAGGAKRKGDLLDHWSLRKPSSYSCSLHRLPVIGDKIKRKKESQKNKVKKIKQTQNEINTI